MVACNNIVFCITSHFGNICLIDDFEGMVQRKFNMFTVEPLYQDKLKFFVTYLITTYSISWVTSV